MTILITGPTGKIGRYLVGMLKGRMPLRTMVRNPDQLKLFEHPDIEPVPGGFERPETLETAFKEIDTLFLLVPPHPMAADWNRTAIDIAKMAGIRRVVRISAIAAGPDGPNDNSRQHGQADDYLRASGLASTILRAHYFMQNDIEVIASGIAANASFSIPTGDARLGMIDARDLAAASAAALQSSQWDGETVDLTGPRSLSYFEAAEILSDLIHRKVTFKPTLPVDFANFIRPFTGDWGAEMAQTYYEAYARGWGGYVTDGVKRLTGREPHDYTDFARNILVPAVIAQSEYEPG